MVWFVRVACCVSVVALAACSDSGSKKKYFETEGLLAPISSCSIDPRSFGDAEPISDIDEGNGCGIQNAWRVRTVSGVRLSQPAVVNCNIAGRFNEWVERTVQQAAEYRFGERVTEVKIAASYSCRPRNNRRGAKMSEHGFGNAIDVAGFTLESGRTITVLDGWKRGSEEKSFLKDVRTEACGPFRTVLGPGSDANHKDHLHLDLQNRRSGKAYCH
jgi:hypothetical protein